VNVPLWAWLSLAGLVPVLIAVDLLSCRAPAGQTPSLRRTVSWSILWFLFGIAFTGVVAAELGSTAAGEYLSGYLLERSLSLDNIFVFALIFAAFAVPPIAQGRVLLFGIVGALVLRGIFIAVGAALLALAGWVIYAFGALLVFSALKMLRDATEEHEAHPEEGRVARWVGKVVPSTSNFNGDRLFVKEKQPSGNWRRLATPLFTVFLVVAVTDLLFALDSIPAIFAVTDEPYLVFAANAFAVLGMRSLYFALAGAIARFKYLSHGLSVVLLVIGAKMLLSWLWHPPIWLTLLAIVLIVGVSIGYSLWSTRGGRAATPAARPTGVST
jgi:tellurite resistance protein TerC